jgi:hypothetical protein
MSLDTITLIECPDCHKSWPEDRYNGKDPECFKCRIQGVGVSFGPAGKSFWHNATTKEWNDRQVTEAKKNGLDPVPVHTAGVSVSATQMKKLEAPKMKEAV